MCIDGESHLNACAVKKHWADLASTLTSYSMVSRNRIRAHFIDKSRSSVISLSPSIIDSISIVIWNLLSTKDSFGHD